MGPDPPLSLKDLSRSFFFFFYFLPIHKAKGPPPGPQCHGSPGFPSPFWCFFFCFFFSFCFFFFLVLCFFVFFIFFFCRGAPSRPPVASVFFTKTPPLHKRRSFKDLTIFASAPQALRFSLFTPPPVFFPPPLYSFGNDLFCANDIRQCSLHLLIVILSLYVCLLPQLQCMETPQGFFFHRNSSPAVDRSSVFETISCPFFFDPTITPTWGLTVPSTPYLFYILPCLFSEWFFSFVAIIPLVFSLSPVGAVTLVSVEVFLNVI